MLIIAIISISSFLLVFLIQEFSEPTAFYLLPTRAWELLAGALCAFFAGRIVPNKNFAVSGLVLILGSITMLSGDELWPSTWTLIPVLGTSLILLQERRTV